MNPNLREDIVAHLTKKGNYESTVDDYLIDELLINIDLSNECLKSLKGHIVEEYEYKAGTVITRINPMVNAYQMFQRNINQLSTKLGINRADRLKLKLMAEKLEDTFTEDFG